MINDGLIITTTAAIVLGVIIIMNNTSGEEFTNSVANLDHHNTNNKNSSKITMIWKMIPVRNVKSGMNSATANPMPVPYHCYSVASTFIIPALTMVTTIITIILS